MNKDKLTLVLDDNNRILHVAWYMNPLSSAISINRNALPDGDITQYKYINNEFIYDPRSEPEPAIPTPTAEERISELESDKKLMDAQIQALSARNDFLEDCIAEMATIIYA